jgi:hypothetical protein
MAKEEIRHIDINNTTPDLLRLAEEVRHSQKPVVLVRQGEDLAIVSPVPRTASRRVSTREEVLALRGAAGTLPHPLPWDEVRRIAQEDRAEEILSSGK